MMTPVYYLTCRSNHLEKDKLSRPLELPFFGTSIINFKMLIFNDIYSTCRLKTATEEQKSKPPMSCPT